MARRVRSDIKIGNLERTLGVKPGTFRNPGGRNARSDKTLGTLRKEQKGRQHLRAAGCALAASRYGG